MSILMYTQHNYKTPKPDPKRIIKKAIHNSICCKHSHNLEIRLKRTHRALRNARKEIEKLGSELAGAYMKIDSIEMLGKKEEQLKHDIRVLVRRRAQLLKNV